MPEPTAPDTTGPRRASRSDGAAVRSLLATERLPTIDLPEDLDGFVVLEVGEDVIGVGGIETHGRFGLIRSVAVIPDRRGEGLGRTVVCALLGLAAERGLSECFLLTESAERFFADLGFERVERPAVPEEIASSREFAELCPSTAVVMRLSVRPK